MLGTNNNKRLLTDNGNFTIQGNYIFNKNVVSTPPPSNNSHLANKGYVDGRISTLSAQIAELSKKIETVSSGSGGSNWVGELGIANFLLQFSGGLIGLVDADYTSKIKLVTRTLRAGANMVNPTNRDCIAIVNISSRTTNSPGRVISSSHGEAFLSEYRMDSGWGVYEGWKGLVQLSKGAYMSYSGSGTLNIAYILVKN